MDALRVRGHFRRRLPGQAHSHYRNIASCPVGLMGLSSALSSSSVLGSLERASDSYRDDQRGNNNNGQEAYFYRALLGQNASAAPSFEYPRRSTSARTCATGW